MRHRDASPSPSHGREQRQKRPRRERAAANGAPSGEPAARSARLASAIVLPPPPAEQPPSATRQAPASQAHPQKAAGTSGASPAAFSGQATAPSSGRSKAGKRAGNGAGADCPPASPQRPLQEQLAAGDLRSFLNAKRSNSSGLPDDSNGAQPPAARGGSGRQRSAKRQQPQPPVLPSGEYVMLPPASELPPPPVLLPQASVATNNRVLSAPEGAAANAAGACGDGDAALPPGFELRALDASVAALIPRRDEQWYYRDPENSVHGPFSAARVQAWARGLAGSEEHHHAYPEFLACSVWCKQLRLGGGATIKLLLEVYAGSGDEGGHASRSGGGTKGA